MPLALVPTCCLSFLQEHPAIVQGVSLTEGRICTGIWKQKESLGCLRSTCSPYINRIQAAAAAPLVQAIPAHLYLPCNMLHMNHGELQLCPEAVQT